MVTTSILLKPTIADAVDWGQFQGSVNKGFSSENIYDSSKIYAFIISIIAVIIIIIVFRWWSAQLQQEQKKNFKQYKEKQKELEAKNQNSSHKRKWFRLRTQAQLRWIPADQAEHVRESKYFVDQLIDISAEGMCFTTAQELTPGTSIEFLLDTGDDRSLPIIGEVLRIFDAEGSTSSAFDGESDENEELVKRNVAIKFSYMTPGNNDRLVAWITKRQRDAIHERSE